MSELGGQEKSGPEKFLTSLRSGTFAESERTLPG